MLALLFFRGGGSSAPVVKADPGGYFKNPNKGFNLEEWKKRQKPQKDLEADLEALYRDLTETRPVEAAQIVRPFAKSEQAFIAPAAVDWGALLDHLQAIEALYALQDEDDIEFLLLNS